jgi:putative transposase
MTKRFTGAQIVGFLREADAGVAVKDRCRKHGFSEGSYYGLAKQVRREERVGREAPERR